MMQGAGRKGGMNRRTGRNGENKGGGSIQREGREGVVMLIRHGKYKAGVCLF